MPSAVSAGVSSETSTVYAVVLRGGDLVGLTISNGFFIGDGGGLTNIAGGAGTLTNILAGTNITIQAGGGPEVTIDF